MIKKDFMICGHIHIPAAYEVIHWAALMMRNISDISLFGPHFSSVVAL